MEDNQEITQVTKEKSGASAFILLLLMVFLAGAAVYFTREYTKPAPDIVEEESLDPALIDPPSEPNLCMAAATTSAISFVFPYENAEKYAELLENDIVMIGAVTTDGWYGFEPMMGSNNVSIFALRWLPPNAPIVLSPECGEILTVPQIMSENCYATFSDKTPVFETNDTVGSSTPKYDALTSDYAIVDIAKSTTEWVSVTIQGETPVVGYVHERAVTLYGACQKSTMDL